MFLFLSLGVQGSSKEPREQASTFNPTEAIMKHIADAHYWHIGGPLSIPLPVIIYTHKGFEVFSSSVFHHGHQSYKGKYYTYQLVKNKIKVVDATGKVDKPASYQIYDLSITKNVVSIWLSVLLLILIFRKVAKAYHQRIGKAPKGLQSLLEPVIIFIRDDIAKPHIGGAYDRFMPFLLSIFFFIWVNNLIGLIPIFPGGANVTGNVLCTFFLATITFFVVHANASKRYWKHIFLPHVPWWLYPIVVTVEVLGVCSRPFALMIRLYANIAAGHIIVLSFISLIFIFKTITIAPISLIFILFIDVLELLVAFLQAFIFTMLTALFIGIALRKAPA